ncbi:MAG: adenylosuccinate lyase family protein [Rhodobacteraceae bacterium]|nr:adenylosuccinate lyase family protein [Paracoccaceae bacterium]
MAVSPFDSAIYRDLFHDAEVGKLFTDTAEVRAMLLVEGALAKAQGALGLIPEVSARAIHRASLELQVDPGGLARETGQSAVPVPSLVKAFRTAMQAPEHSQYAHFGATSQDIMETAQVLRLRQVLAICEERLTTLIKALGTLAEAHADLPMAGRTYGQVASPVSFGQMVASWGQPLLRHRDRMRELRERVLCVSLSGAAGTLSAMGDKGPEVRAQLAEALGLADPGASWHSERDRVAELSSLATMITGSLGKMGEDLTLLVQSGFNEVRLAQGGGSSTMPQKSNPVLPSILVALARHVAGLNGVIQGATVHRQQRDGAAWFAEWLALPQICMGLARALSAANELAPGIAPQPDRMAAAIDDGTGLIYAEALSFALARRMPRPEAQAAVKALCQEVQKTGTPLADLAARDWPDADFGALFTPAAQLGTAPAEARAFAQAAMAL